MASNLHVCTVREGLAVVLFMLSSIACAQVVVQADSVKLQPLIGRDDAGFVSCGVGAVVVVANSESFDAYDFSLVIRADYPIGTLKAGKSRTSVEHATSGKYRTDTVLPAPIKFWIAREDQGIAVSPIQTLASETNGYILEAARLGSTHKAIVAIIHGMRMHFAVRYESEETDRVVAFSANMSKQERTPLLICMQGVFDRLKKRLSESGR